MLSRAIRNPSLCQTCLGPRKHVGQTETPINDSHRKRCKSDNNPGEVHEGAAFWSLVDEAFRAASRPGIDAGLWGLKDLSKPRSRGLPDFGLSQAGSKWLKPRNPNGS